MSGSASLACSDTAASPVGAYPIVATQGTLDSQDYMFNFVNGTLTVTQEVLSVDSNQTLNSLEVSSNVAAVVDAAANLVVYSPVALDSGGSVSVAQDGVLTAPGIDAQPGAAGINLDSGTLQATAGFSTSAPITLGPGGGTIDDGGTVVALAGSITGSGGLTTTGYGTVVLSGANTYGGATTVVADTLIANSASAIPAATCLIIGAGATMSFDPSIGTGSMDTVTAAPALFDSASAAAVTIAPAAAVSETLSVSVSVPSDSSDGTAAVPASSRPAIRATGLAASQEKAVRRTAVPAQPPVSPPRLVVPER